MPKLFVLLLICIGLSPSYPTPSPVVDRIEEFNTSWNRFYRKLHGCEPTVLRIEECREAEGVWGMKEWEEVKGKGEGIR